MAARSAVSRRAAMRPGRWLCSRWTAAAAVRVTPAAQLHAVGEEAAANACSTAHASHGSAAAGAKVARALAIERSAQSAKPCGEGRAPKLAARPTARGATVEMGYRAGSPACLVATAATAVAKAAHGLNGAPCPSEDVGCTGAGSLVLALPPSGAEETSLLLLAGGWAVPAVGTIASSSTTGTDGVGAAHAVGAVCGSSGAERMPSGSPHLDHAPTAAAASAGATRAAEDMVHEQLSAAEWDDGRKGCGWQWGALGAGSKERANKP